MYATKHSCSFDNRLVSVRCLWISSIYVKQFTNDSERKVRTSESDCAVSESTNSYLKSNCITAMAGKHKPNKDRKTNKQQNRESDEDGARKTATWKRVLSPKKTQHTLNKHTASSADRSFGREMVWLKWIDEFEQTFMCLLQWHTHTHAHIYRKKQNKTKPNSSDLPKISVPLQMSDRSAVFSVIYIYVGIHMLIFIKILSHVGTSTSSRPNEHRENLLFLTMCCSVHE